MGHKTAYINSREDIGDAVFALRNQGVMGDLFFERCARVKRGTVIYDGHIYCIGDKPEQHHRTEYNRVVVDADSGSIFDKLNGG